jgi:DNA-binding winged helix-turn-helix (wHTH) protein/Tfp pilus assembly protein PilF
MSVDYGGRGGGVLRFGIFEVDLRAGELYKNGRRVHVQEQPFRLLVMLLERSGDLVTRDEVRGRLWADCTFVDFDHGIRTAINKVREALGDVAENPRFIETLPRHGYRFIAPVFRGSLAKLASPPPVNSPADQAYLKGSYALKRSAGGLVTGIQHFRECIARDANHAQAYVGLALLHLQMGFGYGPLTPAEALSEARNAALQALKLDATLAEAIGSLAWVRSFGEWQWEAADREFRSAVQLNAASPEVHRLYSWYLSAMGHSEQAIAHGTIARDLDPASLQCGYGLAAAYWWSREYEQAAAEAETLVQMDPTFPGAHRICGAVNVQRKAYDEAIAAFDRANVLSGNELSTWALAHLAYGYAAAGRDAEACELLDHLERRSKETYGSPYLFALIHTSLRSIETAFEWLERGYAEKNPMLAFLRVDPLLDALRSFPRFQSLIERMKFPS